MDNYELHISNDLSVTPGTKKVPFQKSFDLLKELAAKGTVSWKGKKLLLDLFSKVQFFYEVRKLNGELQLSGKFHFKKEIDLETCQFISPCNPIWFIVDNQLRVVSTEVSWLDLQKLPRIIDQRELEELIKEAEDLNSPLVKLLFEGQMQEDPKPLLVLTDRSGAFANLMMNYGKEIYPFEDPSHAKNRKKDAETYWEKDLVETGYSKKIVDRSHYYCPLNVVGKSIAFLLELGWSVQDYLGREVLLENSRELVCTANMHLEGQVKFGAYKADLKNVLGAFTKRDRFIDLGTGKSGLILDEDPLAIIAEEIEGIGNTPTLKRNQLGLLDTTWTIPKNYQFLISSLKSTSPSALFQGKLRPYQQEGLSWLAHLQDSNLHGILADEMGLGKTIQVIAYLSLRKTTEKHLIVVPTSLLFNWEKELEKFLPTATTYRHHGTNRKAFPDSGIIITSYHTLESDKELFKEVFWDSIILDEAQVVKNPDGQIAKALYTLKSHFRLAMTGTIIENHSKELWAHFHFLMPGMLGERDYFEKQLSIATVDSRYVKKIQKMIHPFIMRRKKEEVAKDLPPLEEHIAYVEMPTQQRKIYDNFLAATRQGLLKKIQLEGSGKNRMEIFEALLRLRQIACHPLLVSGLVEASNESGKMEALFLDLEAIREEGKKALIFSQFSSMLALIGKRLKEENIPFCLLEGSTTNREVPVKTFQEDPEVPFFLMTLKAGGVGLNLTAADYVLLYDPWWHDAAEAQAIARAHRIGQTKPIIAKRYITSESIEEKMLSLKKAKSALFSNLLEGEQNLNLSEDDLTYLLT